MMNIAFSPFHFGASIICSNPEIRTSDEVEFIDTFGMVHWKTIIALARELSGSTSPKNPSSYTFAFEAEVAGQFAPDIKTGVGRASYSPKYKEISCWIYLGFETFRNISEAKFRETLLTLMTEAMGQMIRLAEKKAVPINFADVRSKWKDVSSRYLATPLPMQPPIRKPLLAPPIPTTGVDYHFVFDTLAKRQAFLTKVKPFKLSIEREKSEGRYWCTLTDEAATEVEEELESKLIQACSELEGEYDGFAAPPPFKPTVI